MTFSERVRGALGRSIANELVGPYPSWADAEDSSHGYSDPLILDRVKAAAIRVRAGEGAFERDSVVRTDGEVHWPFVSAAALAAQQGRLRVVDFGGSLGSLYFQHLGILRILGLSKWVVVEQPHFVEVGQGLLGDETLLFEADLDQALHENGATLGLFSSVLHYLPDFTKPLATVLAAGPQVVSIDRTFLTASSEPRIWVQRVPKAIYEASYPCWLIPVEEVEVQLLEAGYAVVARYENSEFPAVKKRGGYYGGLLAVKKAI